MNLKPNESKTFLQLFLLAFSATLVNLVLLFSLETIENVISKFKINYFEQPKIEIEIASKSVNLIGIKKKQPFFILEQFKKVIRRRRRVSDY